LYLYALYHMHMHASTFMSLLQLLQHRQQPLELLHVRSTLPTLSFRTKLRDTFTKQHSNLCCMLLQWANTHVDSCLYTVELGVVQARCGSNSTKPTAQTNSEQHVQAPK